MARTNLPNPPDRTNVPNPLARTNLANPLAGSNLPDPLVQRSLSKTLPRPPQQQTRTHRRILPSVVPRPARTNLLNPPEQTYSAGLSVRTGAPNPPVHTSAPNPPGRLRWGQLCRYTGQALWGLLFPVSCAGCGLPEVILCNRCRAKLFCPPREVTNLLATAPTSAWTLSLYQEEARRIIVAAKHSRARFFLHYLAEIGFCTGQALVQGLETKTAGPLVIVPCPSRFSLRIGQKNRCALSFARGTAAGIQAVAPLLEPRCLELLKLKPLAEKQAGKNRQARLHARRSAMRLSRRHCRQLLPQKLAEQQILLVDDVITTGATMREASRVINASGGKVLGLVALSAVAKL